MIKDIKFLQCTTHICGQRLCKVTSLGIECDMQDILTILRRSIVVGLYQYVPQLNGGVALHFCTSPGTSPVAREVDE